MPNKPPTYRPIERRGLEGLSDALHAGLSPDIGAQTLGDIQSQAQQRLAELQARRAAQKQAAQAAMGQLGALAIQTASQDPNMSSEQLTGIMGAQQEALGLGPKIDERVSGRMPEMVGALYNPDQTSVFASAGGMDAEDEAAVTQLVAQSVQQGVPLADIMTQISTTAIAAGADPQLYQNKAREVYARFDPNSAARQAQINAMATDPGATEEFAQGLGLEVLPPENDPNDYLTVARQLYAQQLAQGLNPQNPYLQPAG